MIKEILDAAKQVFTSGWILVIVLIMLMALFCAWQNKQCLKKRNKKHQEWWKEYHDWRQEQDFWKTVPEPVLKKKELLEEIIAALGAYNPSYTFDGMKITAVIKIGDKCLVLKNNKNSRDLFLSYNLIKKDKTMSKLADFRTIINDREADYITITATKINDWLKGEWNKWQLK